jgi:hypothetical protein
MNGGHLLKNSRAKSDDGGHSGVIDSKLVSAAASGARLEHVGHSYHPRSKVEHFQRRRLVGMKRDLHPFDRRI